MNEIKKLLSEIPEEMKDEIIIRLFSESNPFIVINAVALLKELKKEIKKGKKK